MKKKVILILLSCFILNEGNCMEDKQEKKFLKIGKICNSLNALYGPEYEKDVNYEYGAGAFLHDLFCLIFDAGLFIYFDYGTYAPKNLNKRNHHFGGNVTYAEIKENNQIKFGNYNDDFEHEMDLDEFLRLNEEYHKAEEANVDEIIFSRIGNKVTLEPIWYDKEKKDDTDNKYDDKRGRSKSL